MHMILLKISHSESRYGTCLLIITFESKSLGSFLIFTYLFTYFVNNNKNIHIYKFINAIFIISIPVYL